MSPFRLSFLLALPVLLAACGDNNSPPPAATPAAPAPAASAPAVPAAAATPAPAAAPLPAATQPVAATDDLSFLWGNWAADLNDCGSGLAVSIDETSFTGAENSCQMSGLTDNGDGSYAADLACQGQGQAQNEGLRMTPVFTPTGEGIVLEYPDRGAGRSILLRCSGG